MTIRRRIDEAGEQIATGMLMVGQLAVADRRWSAPMLACALGLGLFIGTALGPASERSAAGSLIALEGTGAVPAATAEPEPSARAGSSGSARSSADGGSDAAPTFPAPATSAPIPVAPPPPAPPPDPRPPGGGGGGSGGRGGGGGLELSGVVLGANPAAGSYALSDGGQVYAIHAETLPRLGAKLEVPVAELANGTYEEDGSRIADGTVEEGTLEGLVTYVRSDPDAPGYTVSVPGASILVHAPDPGGLPTIGQFVLAQVDIEQLTPLPEARRSARERGPALLEDAGAEPGCAEAEPVERPAPQSRLVEAELVPSGDAYTYGDLAGIVEAVCPETAELVITADGRGESSETITIAVPAGFDLSGVEVDEPVITTAMLEGARWTLAGLGSDDGVEGADDDDQLEGDLAG